MDDSHITQDSKVILVRQMLLISVDPVLYEQKQAINDFHVHGIVHKERIKRAEVRYEFGVQLDHVLHIMSHDLDENLQTVHQFEISQLGHWRQIEQLE